MKSYHIVAALLILLTFATLIGMLIKSDLYWLVYNCAVILFAFLGANALLKHKC